MKHFISYGFLSLCGLWLMAAHAEPQRNTAGATPATPTKKGESYYEKRAKQLQQQDDDARNGKRYYARRKDPQDHLRTMPGPQQIPGAKNIPGNEKKIAK